MMTSIRQPDTKINRQRRDKFEITGRPAGIQRTQKLIHAMRQNEIQFLIVCSQIRLDDFRQERAERQRDDRRAKRKTSDSY